MFAVLTGAPNVGKSTTIEMLGSLGCTVMNEIAEQVINEGEHKPWLGDSEQLAFQVEVANRQAAAEARLGHINDVVYLDRGIADAIAYRLIYGRSLTDLHLNMQAQHYSAVFVFEPVDGWDNNGVRYEDPDFARAMTPVMRRVYESFGVPVVNVPCMSKQERTQFIMNCMTKVGASAPVGVSSPLLRMAA